jgi:rhodanese-related sulfurtransferase
MRKAGENFVIVDGRPFSEYQKMNIPDGICCPNGELVLCIHDIAPDPKTKIVVNCAGRTRSIIGAQTLIDFGVPNPVFALENGTQGWFLAGFQLERGADRRHDHKRGRADATELQSRARRLATSRGVGFVDVRQAQQWLADGQRTTYLLDVRTPEEAGESGVPGFAHAPGGQLIQATDQWVGVRGARLVLMDSEQVRAPVVAGWLRQLGHEAYALEGGAEAASAIVWEQRSSATIPPTPPEMPVPTAAQALRQATVQAIDLRPSMIYRKEHIMEAVWSIRPRLARVVAADKRTVLLVADDPNLAALAALDLAEAGCSNICMLQGGHAAWRAAGLPVTATPDQPSDADCIDFVFHTHARHDGSREAAQQYLSWELGLPGQLDPQERGAFRL